VAAEASTQPATPTPTDGSARSTDLVLAGLHLRLGSLALARASLETLAGRDALDDDGLVDLAEARWRTGDVAGAGEAALALLGDRDDGPLVALVVAAEAAMALGRPTEARRFARRAMNLAGDGLDAIFAGMPRAAVWPADPLAAPPSAATMFDVAAVGPARDRATEADPAVDDRPSAPDIDPMGLWDTVDGAPADPDGDPDADRDTLLVPDLPAPEDELDRGRDALQAGRPVDAAVHLGMVLRVRPALAPAVLDLVVDDRSATLAFVRGDAYRLVGRELDARRAFADAVRQPGPADPADPAGPADRADQTDATEPAASPTDDPPPEGEPA